MMSITLKRGESEVRIKIKEFFEALLWVNAELVRNYSLSLKFFVLYFFPDEYFAYCSWYHSLSLHPPPPTTSFPSLLSFPTSRSDVGHCVWSLSSAESPELHYRLDVVQALQQLKCKPGWGQHSLGYMRTRAACLTSSACRREQHREVGGMKVQYCCVTGKVWQLQRKEYIFENRCKFHFPVPLTTHIRSSDAFRSQTLCSCRRS